MERWVATYIKWVNFVPPSSSFKPLNHLSNFTKPSNHSHIHAHIHPLYPLYPLSSYLPYTTCCLHLRYECCYLRIGSENYYHG